MELKTIHDFQAKVDEWGQDKMREYRESGLLQCLHKRIWKNKFWEAWVDKTQENSPTVYFRTVQLTDFAADLADENKHLWTPELDELLHEHIDRESRTVRSWVKGRQVGPPSSIWKQLPNDYKFVYKRERVFPLNDKPNQTESEQE